MSAKLPPDIRRAHQRTTQKQCDAKRHGAGCVRPPRKPGSQAAGARRRKYGLTNEAYQALYAAQSGVCAICYRAGILCVDHNHETNKVRGLLCTCCNTALGSLQDSPDRLRAAALYLEKNDGK